MAYNGKIQAVTLYVKAIQDDNPNPSIDEVILHKDKDTRRI